MCPNYVKTSKVLNVKSNKASLNTLLYILQLFYTARYVEFNKNLTRLKPKPDLIIDEWLIFWMCHVC